MQKNIFLDMFSLVNKIYTVEDYLIPNNIPVGITDYYYVSKGIELEGRYFNYTNEHINVYVIRDSNNHSFEDIMLFNNKPTVILVVPSQIDGKDTSEINKRRVDNTKRIYNYLFRSIGSNMDVTMNCSLSKLLLKASPILTLFTELTTMQSFDIEDIICEEEGVTMEFLEKASEYDIETLFVKGGLLSLL